MIKTMEPYTETEDPKDVYLPSPERIGRLTAAIRRAWSVREYEKRSAVKVRRWIVAVISINVEESGDSDSWRDS